MENKKETKEQKTERLLSYLNESILDVICSDFDYQSAGYFEDKPITDDGCVDFAEWYEGWNGFNHFMELLQKDRSFQADLMELVKHVAYTREPTK
ncbi:MAG: hypothetical protein J6T10_30140 [Methanobrevibacter sp.]|nr:hypothetical protein [Methanobrevibacter sp.]